MLIDDRQIHSISALKVIGLSRVGLTNNYNDLDNIPTSFPPAEHTHPLASADGAGFMSKEEYIKLKNINEFKYINIKSGDTFSSIKATSENDILTLEAGKNIVFNFDSDTNTLYLSVDYTVEEANLKGPKGDKGDKGDDGKIWRPIVDIDGNLSFEVNNSLTAPTTMNIRGKEGGIGPKGEDAPTPIWDNLDGKPCGNIGDILFVKEDSSSKFESGPIFIEGMFPNSEEELNNYRLLKYNYKFIKDNWIRKYTTKEINPLLTEEQISRYWDINVNGIGFTRKDSGYSFLTDYKIYEDYEIEVTFEHITPTGATSMIIASRTGDTGFSTLSFVRILNRDGYDLYPYENIFYNFAIVIDLNSGDELVVDKISIDENIPSGEIKFKIKAIRKGNNIKVYWTNCVSQDDSYPEYINESFNIDLTSITPLNKFIGSGNVGIGCINQIFSNALFNTEVDKSNTIYPLYKDSDTNLYKSYKCSIYDGIWKSSNENIYSEIGIGRYIKDINTNRLYFIDRDEIIFIRESSLGDSMAYINYVMDTPITKELEN